MDRADSTSLAKLQPLLDQLRVLPGIRESENASFYRKDLYTRFWSLFQSRNEFLHFHQANEPTVDHRCHELGTLFADLRADVRKSFQRFPVDTPEQHEKLLAEVRSVLKVTAPAK